MASKRHNKQVLASELAFFVLLSFLSYVSIVLSTSVLFRCASVLLLVWYTHHCWTHSLRKLIKLKDSNLIYGLLGITSLILLYGLVFGAVITFGTLTSVALWRSIVGVSAVVVNFGMWCKYGKKYQSILKKADAPLRTKIKPLFKESPVLLGAYVVAVAGTIWFLGVAQSDGIIYSPWQALSGFVPWLFAALVCLQVLLINSKASTKTLFVTVVITSVLTQMYIVASHSLPVGGDVWRHIGIEQEILAGESIRPGLTGDIELTSVGNVQVPTIFTQPQQFAYGQLWGLVVATHELTNASLEQIHRWLIPILWGMSVPTFLYVIGLLAWRSKRVGLWLGVLQLIPFTLQATGAITMPVSFGVLNLLLWGITALVYLQHRTIKHRSLFWVMTVLLLWSYTNAFLIALISIGLYLLSTVARNRSALIALPVQLLMVLLVPLSILGLELLSGTTQFGVNDMMTNLKQLVGQATGWFIATGIRPHDIASFNLFINHLPQYATHGSLWLYARPLLIPFLLTSYAILKLGMFALQQTRRRWALSVSALYLGLWLTYLIGWFFMEGDRTIVRRLDPFIGIMSIMVGFAGVQWVLAQSYIQTYIAKIPSAYAILASVLIAGSMTSVMVLGPDIRSTSVTEVAVAQTVVAWTQEDNITCVIADPWLHLPIEAYTSRDLIGGGFPVGHQYAQAQLHDVLKTLPADPEQAVRMAVDTIGTDTCLVVQPVLDTSIAAQDMLRDVYGDPDRIEHGYTFYQITVSSTVAQPE